MMKTMKKIKDITLAGTLLLAAYACSPDHVDIGNDIHEMDPSQISRIEIKPQNLYLIANGKAQMTFTPIVYYQYDGQEYKMLQDRVKDEWFDFTCSEGQLTDGIYTTSDASMIGKTITVTAKVKDNTSLSDDCTFSIVAPPEQMEDITLPIVFHVLRNEGEDKTLGYDFTDTMIQGVLDKMNQILAGELTTSPVGVDTHIRLKPAVYTPSGSQLPTPGIHRITVPAGTIGNDFDITSVPETYTADWSYKDYLNVWLIAISEELPTFAALGQSTGPMFVNLSAMGNLPAGYELTPLPDGFELPWPGLSVGVFYRAENLNNFNRNYTVGTFQGLNELIHYIGNYLGLKDNNNYNSSTPPDNYCEDVPSYGIDEKWFGSNKTDYKETESCFYHSDNIMDDATGFHTSVSQDQAELIRTILNSCPTRVCHKSNYAFTGQRE